jgi:hypothetical protein
MAPRLEVKSPEVRPGGAFRLNWARIIFENEIIQHNQPGKSGDPSYSSAALALLRLRGLSFS